MSAMKEKTFSFLHVDGDPCILSNKDHGDSTKVFAEVQRLGRFSAFDMTQTLWNTLGWLKKEGKIKEIPAGYPVMIFRVKEESPPPSEG